jgi:hypothetical protein
MRLKLQLVGAACFSILTILSVPATAQEQTGLTFIYEQPMGGVYTQGWSAQSLDFPGGTSKRLYVVGDGKAGNFYGILSIDCHEPTRSQWLAVGGHVTPDRVPSEAIVAMRSLVCSG